MFVSLSRFRVRLSGPAWIASPLRRGLRAATVVLFWCGQTPLGAEEAAADRHPDLKRLSPAADVWIDVTNKQVVVGGQVCLDKGPIEYFACPKDTKDYESLVAVRASAHLVHAALLAVGLEPRYDISNGGLDANWMAANGIPTVTLGCGQMDIHTTSERLDLSAYERACEVALRLATA